MLTGYEGPAFNAPDNRIQRRPSIGAAVARLKESEPPRAPLVRRRPQPPGRHGQPLPLFRLPRRAANPFIVESDPNDPAFQVKNLTLPGGLSSSVWKTAGARSRPWTSSGATSIPTVRDLDAYYQRAFAMLTGQSVADAFDIGAESAAVRDRYGRHTFGQTRLMARRLVEAGTPFVTVNCVPWDHHGTAPQLKTEEGARS